MASIAAPRKGNAPPQSGADLNVSAAIPPGLKNWAGRIVGPSVEITPLPGDGGGRCYFRISGRGLLLLAGPDAAENLAWLRIGRHLWFKGLGAPRIFEADLNRGFFILEDLGDELLTGPRDQSRLYPLAIDLLAGLHRRGLDGFNTVWCHQTKAYDAFMIREQEIAYFLRALISGFLKMPDLPKGVWGEAGRLARAAAPEPAARVLMHRDFQGRNLIYKQGRLYVIDWQGARSGPAAYDLASLLEETPYHSLSADFKDELVSLYIKSRGRGAWVKTFRQEMVLVGACRLMQALGAYGKLSLNGKPKFAAF
ncbi:phosphotransferase, partial [Deltaproteobacteria bacterium OttesenSCG-928-K17]|nr:phosphotransferase [Deltaproteobacteria bacterium OttesenSCG-928-K17]